MADPSDTEMTLGQVLSPMLAKKLARGDTSVDQSLTNVPIFRQAKVLAININGTVNLAVDGHDLLVVNNVRFMNTYMPHVGDAVWALSIGRGKWLVGGRILPNPTATEVWHEIGATNEPAFSNSWVNFGGSYQTAAFCKTPDGWVHLKGLIASGTAATTMFTLPVGYRPGWQHISVITANGIAGRVDVNINGTVVLATGTNAYVQLDGIQFRSNNTSLAAFNIGSYETEYQWVRMPFSDHNQSVGVYNDANFTGPLLMMNDWGLVRSEGIMINPSAVSVWLTRIPDNMSPHYSALFIGFKYSGVEPITVSAEWGAMTQGTAAAGDLWISVSGFEWFNETTADQWGNATGFVNSWGAYSGAAPFHQRYPQYWKDPYGFVHLRGLLGGGSAASTMFTLPVGYRPAATSLHIASATGAFGRIDVDTAGGVHHVLGTTTYLALDNINFRAAG